MTKRQKLTGTAPNQMSAAEWNDSMARLATAEREAKAKPARLVPVLDGEDDPARSGRSARPAACVVAERVAGTVML